MIEFIHGILTGRSFDTHTNLSISQRGEDALAMSAREILSLAMGKGLTIAAYQREEGGWHTFAQRAFDERSWEGLRRRRNSQPWTFEGGSLGWLEEDGTVIRSGLIFAEEEVGRVEGPYLQAAAAALLLIFVPEDDEASREMKRRE